MKYNNIKKLVVLLLMAVLFYNCSRDEIIFTGDDNFISSFELTQGDIILYGHISEDSIIVKAPANLSLDGAEVSITISENAIVRPSPSAVTDWDQPYTFTITSYEKTSHVYYYSVERTNVVNDGDVTLITQADVEAFAALEINEINGNLIIGMSTGEDSISSLSSLSELKIVNYDLIINQTYKGTDLTGLENLEKAGSVHINSLEYLEDVSFPALVSIMSDLTVSNKRIKTLEFPELTDVGNGIRISNADSLASVDFPKLENVVSDLYFYGSSKNKGMTEIEFPVLKNVGGVLTCSYWPFVNSLSCPELTMATSVDISRMDSVKTISMPNLQIVLDEVSLSDMNVLTGLDMSSLTTVYGNMYLSSLSVLADLDGLNSVTTVGEELTLRYLYLIENFSGLSSLVSVSGLTIYQTPFVNLEDFSSLSSVSSVYIYNDSQNTSIEEIDVTGFDGLESIDLRNIYNSFSLKGNDVFDGTLYLYYSNAEITGFKEVTKVTIYGYNTDSNVTDLTMGFTRVTEDLGLYLSNISGTFSLPDLEEVGGKFYLQNSSTIDIPVLKEVGTMEVQTGFADGGVFSLSSLEKVHGDFSIKTQLYRGYISDIQLPSLTTVEGILTISADSYRTNTTITNLDGFSALTNTGGITIKYNEALVDYSGLSNCVSSFTADDWVITGNSYNPTYQDLLDGHWTSE